MDSKQDNAGARPATEGICLPPGQILQQLPGSIAYGPDGKALGIVGRDIPAQIVVQLFNGTIRPLTAAEARAVGRWWR